MVRIPYPFPRSATISNNISRKIVAFATNKSKKKPRKLPFDLDELKLWVNVFKYNRKELADANDNRYFKIFLFESIGLRNKKLQKSVMHVITTQSVRWDRIRGVAWLGGRYETYDDYPTPGYDFEKRLYKYKTVHENTKLLRIRRIYKYTKWGDTDSIPDKYIKSFSFAFAFAGINKYSNLENSFGSSFTTVIDNKHISKVFDKFSLKPQLKALCINRLFGEEDKNQKFESEEQKYEQIDNLPSLEDLLREREQERAIQVYDIKRKGPIDNLRYLIENNVCKFNEPCAHWGEYVCIRTSTLSIHSVPEIYRLIMEYQGKTKKKYIHALNMIQEKIIYVRLHFRLNQIFPKEIIKTIKSFICDDDPFIVS